MTWKQNSEMPSLQTTNITETPEVESRLGRHKVPPILELLIYTTISLSHSASYIILQPQPVGSFSCHILAGFLPNQKYLGWACTPTSYTSAFYHLLTPSEREKGLNTKALLSTKDLSQNNGYMGVSQIMTKNKTFPLRQNLTCANYGV